MNAAKNKLRGLIYSLTSVEADCPEVEEVVSNINQHINEFKQRGGIGSMTTEDYVAFVIACAADKAIKRHAIETRWISAVAFLAGFLTAVFLVVR